MHEGAQRLQQVTGNVAGRDAASFASAGETKNRRANFFSARHIPVFTGAAQAETQALHDLLVSFASGRHGHGAALAMLLAPPKRVLILANLAFALVGGVLAVFASVGALSVGSLGRFCDVVSASRCATHSARFSHSSIWSRRRHGPGICSRRSAARPSGLLPILMTCRSYLGWDVLPLAMAAAKLDAKSKADGHFVILGRAPMTSTRAHICWCYRPWRCVSEIFDLQNKIPDGRDSNPKTIFPNMKRKQIIIVPSSIRRATRRPLCRRGGPKSTVSIVGMRLQMKRQIHEQSRSARDIQKVPAVTFVFWSHKSSGDDVG